MAVNRIRRKGSYAPLSAHYYLDDALAQAGEAAELLYVRGLAFCAGVLNDGLITDAQLPRGPGVDMRDCRQRAERLVEVGAWTRVEGVGYRVRTWLNWNWSAEQIQEAMDRDAERKGRPKPRGGPPPSGQDSTVREDSARNPDGGLTEAVRSRNGVREDSVPRARDSRYRCTPDTDVPSGGDLGGEGPDSSARVEEPPRRPRCKQHAHLPGDDPGPNCVRCRDARLAVEAADVEAEQADRDQRAAERAAMRACPECDVEGWRLGSDGTPVEPAERCRSEHHTLRAVS